MSIMRVNCGLTKPSGPHYRATTVDVDQKSQRDGENQAAMLNSYAAWMSDTISEASQIALDSTDCRLTVQFPPLLVRGTVTMSNRTFRHMGCRCKALVTRHLISSSVAGVFAENLSRSIARPFSFAAAATAPGHA